MRNRRIRNVVTILAAAAALVTWVVAPASAGNGATQIGGTAWVVAVDEGSGAFTDDCPVADGYEEFDDLTIQLGENGGNLVGCLYTRIEVSTASPSFDASPFTYHEQGSEVFVGSWYDDDGNELGEGTFETTYRFTGKYEDDSFAVEIHGRCQHPVVAGSGTGVFEGVTGRIDFKDNVETGELTYRGHLK